MTHIEGQSRWSELVGQCCAMTPEDLPKKARDAAARLLADTLICALAGAPLNRSHMLRQAFGTADGAGEAGLWGTGTRQSSILAAAANTEAANLLDADDTFLNGAHFGSLIVSTATVEAERVQASFGRLLNAITWGFEIAARMTLAQTPVAGWLSPGLMGPGAALAAAISAGADKACLVSAMGLAARAAPAPMPLATALGELGSMKYAPYAPLAANAVIAARLAAAGYVSDAGYIGQDNGFFEAHKSRSVDWSHLQPVGDCWWICSTSFKRWPVFRVGQPALDTIADIMTTRQLHAGDIEAVELQLDPRALALPFHDRAAKIEQADDHRLPLYCQMNLPLAAALVILGIPAGARWTSPELVKSDAVRGLLQRIRIMPQPVMSADELWRSADSRSGRAHRCFAKVTILAKGRRYAAQASDIRGDPWSKTPPDWDFLAGKAQDYLGSSAVVDLVAGQRSGQRASDLIERLSGLPCASGT